MKACKHDHSIIDTRFCPHCGAEIIGNDALVSLLEHIQIQAGVFRDRYERSIEGRNESELKHPTFAKWSSRRLRTVEKWEAWRDALREAVSAREAEGG